MKSVIWGLSPDLTLESIQALQSNNYFESIEYLIDRNDLPEDERILKHRWEVDPNIKIFRVNDNSEISYFTAKGVLEFALSKERAFYDDDYRHLIPRRKRVFEHSAGVIVLSRFGKLFSIVYGNDASFKVRTILMGGGRKHRRRKEWGKIEQRLFQYRIDNDLFYWMFHKHKQSSLISTPFGDIEIRDVEGIGRLSARNQHDTRGHGPKSADELSNKSALGVSQLVYESDINVVTKDIDLFLCLSEFSESVVDSTRSIVINGNLGAVSSIAGYEVEVLIKLYVEIIPSLISTYNQDISNSRWTPAIANQAKKEWALEVINELSEYHHLTRAEILNIPWFNHP